MDINKKVLNEVSKGSKMGMDAIKYVSDKVTDNKFQKISHWSWQRVYSIRLMTKKDFSITILSIRVGMIVKEKSFTYKSRLKQIW